MRSTLLFSIFLFGVLKDAMFVGSSSLLGIDFGNEYIKVSIVSPGKGFNILLNNQSKRKITNAISFAGKVRNFDEEAKIYSAKQPQLTLLNSNNFLAFTLLEGNQSEEELKEMNDTDRGTNSSTKVHFSMGEDASKYFAYDYVVDNNRGTINLKLKNDTVLSSEEITANILGYIKKLAYNHLNIDYKTKRNINVHIGCVISVPCNFSQRKKQALQNASKIAGLELLGIINGVTAAAIHNVHDLPLNTTKLTMYLDVGSKNINVGIATISNIENEKVRSRSVKVYACEVLEDNSGNKIDILLAEHLRNLFEKKNNGISISHDKKAMRKLLTAANKAKLLLSAKKSTEVFVESLHNSKSLLESITREEFDNIIEEVIMNFKIPINNALKKSSFELKDIEALELIGSAWRIPKVLNEITKFFDPLQVGMHLNSDEAITMGTLYVAAYNSANFRLKALDYEDVVSNEYTILVSTEEGNGDSAEEKVNGKGTPIELIAYNSKYPVSKTVVLKYRDNLKFSIFENGKMISEYAVNSLDEVTKKKFENLHPPKVNLKFHLDKFCILNLESVLVVYEEVKEKEGEKTEDKTDDKSEEKTEEKTDDKTDDKTDGKTDDKTDGKTDDKTDGKTDDKTDGKTEEKANHKADHKADEEETKAGQVVKHRIPLTYETKDNKPMPLTQEEVKEKKELLKKMDDHDINFFLKSEKKNNLESLIYETRSKMKKDVFKKVCKEEMIKDYLNKLEEYEEWLYTENDEPLENVSDKIRELQDIYNPIKERAEELEGREIVIGKTNKKIKEIQEKINEYSQKKPWAEATIKMIKDSLEKEIAWWNNAQEEQKKIDNFSAPYFKAKEVESKFKAIEMLVKNLEKAKKPTEKKEKKDDNKTEEENKNDNSQDKNTNDGENQANKEDVKEQKENMDKNGDGANKPENTPDGKNSQEPPNDSEKVPNGDTQEQKDEL
ncbi:heat shock protein 110, putative [Plasmodium ovale]|uniref:Heat shock protein 110, putative n=1 Tax=Plasmodium ovale TaxID=36330 RepID=A0A1D3TK28_PLAOA|nr:heat shock protein 110, putative [Plasmodium ovale]